MRYGEPNEQKNLVNDGPDAATYDHGDFSIYHADATVNSEGLFGRKHKHQH
jgi:hypothetical protein